MNERIMGLFRTLSPSECRSKVEQAGLLSLILWSVLVWYSPFSWVLCISENRWLWVELWPALPGLFAGVLIRNYLTHARIELGSRFTVLLASAFSVFFVALTVVVMKRAPRWRFAVLGISLIISSLFSFAAYWIYRD